jgi:hypothetical protein
LRIKEQKTHLILYERDVDDDDDDDDDDEQFLIDFSPIFGPIFDVFMVYLINKQVVIQPAYHPKVGREQ